MAGVQTTIKVGPEDHQALVVLLRYLAGAVDVYTFRAVLDAQGRKYASESAGRTDTELVVYTADALISSFS